MIYWIYPSTMDPLHGKEKPFHNIQPSEEHSPGGRCVSVKVYNQEKISPQGANKAWLDFAKKHLKKPDHFCKCILWTAEIKINLYQNDGKKKKYRAGLDSSWFKAYTSSVKWWSSVKAWACMASSGTELLVFSDDVTEDRSSRWFWSIGIYCLPRFSQM